MKNYDKAFLFSSTNNEKYPSKKPENAIAAKDNCLVIYGGNIFPLFISHDICISDNCNINENSYNFPYSYSYSGSKYPSKSDQSKAYLAGAHEFKVIDIEVFEVIWI